MTTLMKYTSESISLPNSKPPLGRPNEDYCICDDEHGIYIMLDGVSRDAVGGVYPNPSPAAEASEIFAKNAYSYILDMLAMGFDASEFLILDAIHCGNRFVSCYNSSGTYDFLPGTVGMVLMIDGCSVVYGFIGDCFGKVVSAGASRIFTRCQTEYVHKHKKEYTTHEIRNVICNNKGHPAGYGVLNGTDDAFLFVETGCFELLENEKIFLYTDGFEKYINPLPCCDLYNLTVECAKKLCESGQNNPDDDRTLIIIEAKSDTTF